MRGPAPPPPARYWMALIGLARSLPPTAAPPHMIGVPMIDFLLAWSRRDLPQFSDPAFADRLRGLRTPAPVATYKWTPPGCPTLHVWAWGHDVVPLDAADRIRPTSKQLLIFNGWLIPELGMTPLSSATDVARHFADSEAAHGEYLFLDLDEHGNGRVRRNLLASVQLYAHETEELVVLSTRASMVDAFVHGGVGFPLSSDFVRWVATYAVPFSRDALFEGVSAVPQGAQIRIASGRPDIVSPPGDFLFSDVLAEKYVADRQAYWDEAFEGLKCLLKVVDLTDLPITFPLSGGKDSRLLLALLISAGYKERVAEVFTNGPPVSPEVISAELVTQHWGLKHVARFDATATTADRQTITAHLPLHLFVSEGEMTPMDLISRAEPRRNFELHGQEAGLRNIAGRQDVDTKDAVLSWFKRHLASGDVCGVLHPEAREKNLRDIEGFVDLAQADGTPFAQMPSRHRIQYRMARWVGRVWRAHNAIGFAPFIFVSEVVVRSTYNAGPRARYLEEFHFEMLRRIDPKLVEIPFAGQTWDDELLAMVTDAPPKPRPLEWPPDYPVFARRAMMQSLLFNFDSFKDFVHNNAGPVLQSVVDVGKLGAFSAEALRPGHVAPLWQILQAVLAESVTDFAALRNRSTGSASLPDLDQLGPILGAVTPP